MPSSFGEKCIRMCTAWQSIQWNMASFATLADYGSHLHSYGRNVCFHTSILDTLAAAYSSHALRTHDDMHPIAWDIHIHHNGPSAVLEIQTVSPSCRLLIDGDVHPSDDGAMHPKNGGICTHREGSHVPLAVLDTRTFDGHDHLNDRGLHSDKGCIYPIEGCIYPVEGCKHPIEGNSHPIDCDTQLTHAFTCPIDTHTNPAHANLCKPNGNDAGAHRNIPSTDDKRQETDIAALLQGTISLQHCKIIHAFIIESGLIGDIYLVNLVLKVYGKFGAVLDARALFDGMPHPNIISWNTIISVCAHCNALEEACILFHGMLRRNVVSWNTLIAAYAQQEKTKEAILLFQRLYQECELPNESTFVNVLSVCSKLGELNTGKSIHLLLDGCGLGSSLTIGTALVNMYAKCSDLNSSCLAFGELQQHDVVSWTSLISAYAQLGDAESALHLFRQMQQEGVEPNKLTFLSILSAVSSCMSLLSQGKAIHACILLGTLKLDSDIAGALINLYGKCGYIKHALLVFESVASSATCVWNAIMTACVEQSYNWQALSFYKEMLKKGYKLDVCTFASALNACGCLMDLNVGELIHSHIVEEGHMQDVILSNTLITLYTKCRAVEDASYIFEKMHSRSVVTWTCMISAYAYEGCSQQALQLFYQMHCEGARSNDVTLATVLGACVDSIALEQGRTLHTWIAHERKGFGPIVSNAIVNMYGKCGSLKDASFVFNRSHTNNIVSWNTMMASYAHGGHGKEALACFFEMQGEGLEPDEFTFVSLLSACSHAGMIDEGSFCFYFVVDNLYVSLVLEHCVCIVDLLGRAGQLFNARRFVDKVPFLPDSCLWSALQAACKMHGNRVWVCRTSECILEFDRY